MKLLPSVCTTEENRRRDERQQCVNSLEHNTETREGTKRETERPTRFQKLNGTS